MPTILIIEDDTHLRRMLIKLLEREDFRVLEAGTGLEALQILEYYIPDMVITDIIMPDQDGIGTINELKKRHPGVKIIAISGGGRMLSKDYLGIAKILGADHTFSKPFDTNLFLKKVHELINLQESGSNHSV
jgi:DNA-binding response OmpR family regulator